MDNLLLSPGGGIADHVAAFRDPRGALDYLKTLYNQSIDAIQKRFHQFMDGDRLAGHPAEGCYPMVQIDIPLNALDVDTRYAYGIVDAPGLYETTVTRPDLFEEYLLDQLSLLMERYDQPVFVGRSREPIPLPFAAAIHDYPLTAQDVEAMRVLFVMPDLTRINDHVPNNTFQRAGSKPRPLSLFAGERVDFSLHRLHHYTGTSPDHFQNFILLTNYQRYLEIFRQYSQGALMDGRSGYESFVEPGDRVTYHQSFGKDPAGQGADLYLPQMPAFHLKRSDGNGITFINIGVGPSNAKNITDHLAVLRPHAWIMLGHCAGLHRSQQLGDYVLAHGYVRQDHVLDDDLPIDVPVPPIAEIQIALQKAIQKVTGLGEMDAKKRLRTGTVHTTGDRNWELRSRELYEQFKHSRAIALDMESATVAANGLRFRVPYGTLLCVSDKPIHGEIKLRGMANAFYNEQVNRHLHVGIETVHILRDSILSLHSRKLRGFEDPAFR